MQNLLSSASKLVFVLMALAVIAGMFLKIINASDFLTLASMAFVFYFSKPPTQEQSGMQK